MKQKVYSIEDLSFIRRLFFKTVFKIHFLIFYKVNKNKKKMFFKNTTVENRK